MEAEGTLIEGGGRAGGTLGTEADTEGTLRKELVGGWRMGGGTAASGAGSREEAVARRGDKTAWPSAG